MKRVLVNMSNGYCGCDDQYIMSFNDETSAREMWTAMYSAYYYDEGFAGMEDFEKEASAAGYDSVDEYFEAMAEEYSGWEELTEEEYNELIEDGYEERFV